MELPSFLLRKLYKKGSLAEASPQMFRFTLRNVLGPATIVGPPQVTVNGIGYPAGRVTSSRVQLETITPHRPFVFAKGDEVTLVLPGQLLRAANHIQVQVHTKEFGELRIEAEDKCAESCDLPGVLGAGAEE